MVSELDISGEFIYNGISIVNNMNSIDSEMPTELFLALYNISVGIERLQKIILVLWEFDEKEPIEEFSERIKIHNHVELNRRIEKAVGKKANFNKQEYQFLELVKNFYSNARYDRFAEVGNSWEYRLIHKFFADNYIGYERLISNSSIIPINDSIRKLIGRVVFKVVNYYYKLVKEEAKNRVLIHMSLEMIQRLRKYFYIRKIVGD